jgi:CheY-like chemotaxis protein
MRPRFWREWAICLLFRSRRVASGRARCIKVVGQVIDGVDAVRQARRLNPDVVLMDVRMPVMDGLEATRQILTVTRGADRPRVLMLAPSVTRRLIAQGQRPRLPADVRDAPRHVPASPRRH